MPGTETDNKVVVNIFGEEFPITGISDPSYISRIADFVDRKMKDAAASSRIKGYDKIAILAAMSIASELFEQKNKSQQDDQSDNDCIKEMLARMDQALVDAQTTNR